MNKNNFTLKVYDAYGNLAATFHPEKASQKYHFTDEEIVNLLHGPAGHTLSVAIASESAQVFFFFVHAILTI